MTRQEAGRLGGLTTAARYGPGHMATIGAKGFASFANTHCGGDRAKAKAILAGKLDGTRRDFNPTPCEWTIWLDGR